MLSLEGIHKRFGAVQALEDVSLQLHPGRIHAVVGENGAGKTTLLRIAFGMLSPDAGTIRRAGVARIFRSPRDALDAGIGMVHQHFMLAPRMSVTDNIALGIPGPRAEVLRHVDATLRRWSASLSAGLAPDARVETLGIGSQQRVEILKVLARDVSVLILDEPTSVLTPAAATELLDWLARFAHGAERAVVLVTHKLQDVLRVADDITVLRQGRVVLEGPRDGMSQGDLATAVLGAPPDAERPALPGRAASGTVVVHAAGLSVDDEYGVSRIHGAAFDIRKGEIVAIAAVEGAGQRELLRAVAGRLRPSAGILEVAGPVGFIPEDRHADALIKSFTLTENLALRGAAARRGWMHWRALETSARATMVAHDVRAPGPRVLVSSLSGGNQQKLVLGRELAGSPHLLVAENPTQGLDVHAAAAVTAQLQHARNEGMAVLIYSSDLEELLALADRVLVVHAGHVHEAPRDAATIGRKMLGAA